MQPGPKIEHHHMKAMLYKIPGTIGIQSKSKQTHSTIGLYEIRTKFEFYKQSSNFEKKRI